MIAKDKFYSVKHLTDSLDLIRKSIFGISRELCEVQKALKGKTSGTALRNADQINDDNRLLELGIEKQFEIYNQLFTRIDEACHIDEQLRIMIHNIRNRE